MQFETAVPLGRGASGEVLKAWDARLERWVALKFLRSDDPQLLARMQREARLQARLHHPNVAEVYDVGAWEGRPYIAMQLIEGVPLDQAVRDLPLEQRVRLLAVVAHAVHAAHTEGLIHRDLKPGNILVEPGADGVAVPYVLDFGIAREVAVRGETLTGQMLGTPGYLSPEQARGETARLDRRSDVFSLGAVLYEAITGARPFGGDSAVDALVQVLERDPVPPCRRMPGLPRDVETIVLKCLEKDPERRYGSARELAEDLERFLRGDPIAARPPGRLERLARRVRRHPLAAGLAAAAAVALLVLAGVALHARLTMAARTEAAQRFGQMVEQMEATLRYAHLLPLHDVAVEKARVRRMLAAVAAELPRLPPAAEPAARYALGRGHLALDRPAEARRELERAWEEGFRTPQAAHALGLAFARLYEEALETVRQEKNLERRIELRSHARAELALRAISYLRMAGPGALPESRFVEAQVAYLEERSEDALKLAREAIEETPWLYEAELLAGAAHTRTAVQRLERGDWEGCRAALDRAREALEHATRLAPSAVAVRSASCKLALLRIETEDLGATGSDLALYAAAAETCRTALAADRDSPDAYHGLLDFYRIEAARLRHTGAEEARAEILKRGVALARQAERRGVADPRVLRFAAELHRRLADVARRRGEEPDPHLQAAEELLRRGLQHAPGNVSLHDGMAELWQARMELAAPTGAELPVFYRRAEDFYLRCTALDPRRPHCWNNLGVLYLKRGRVAARQRQEDPSPFFHKAIGALERSLELDLSPVTFLNVGEAYKGLAVWEEKRRGDPVPHLERCLAAHDRALEINARFIPSLDSRGDCRITLIRRRMERGTRPSAAELSLCEKDFQAVADLYPGPNGPLGLGRVARLAAAIATQLGEDPLPEALRAIRELETAMTRETGPEVQRELALALRDVARYRRAGGHNASRELTQAAAVAHALLAEGPADPEIAELLSEIERMTGRSAGRATER